MKGGFDLYGNYYPNINDALNAEMAQCNEIDNRLNREKLKSLEKDLSRLQEQQSEREYLMIIEAEKRGFEAAFKWFGVNPENTEDNKEIIDEAFKKWKEAGK